MGRPAVDELVRLAPAAGIFLDFDGVLAEVVSTPDAARPLPGVSETLRDLARRFARVAVVSGRSAHQLAQWLGPEIDIWGLHGAEHAHAGDITLAESVRPYVAKIRQARDDALAAVDALGLDGVVVEDKAAVVALHYRTAADRPRAEAALDELSRDLAARHGLERGEAKLVFELKPPVGTSKAIVVRERSGGLAAAAFVGDDTVDLPAFDALDDLAADGLHTVRIAVASREAPRELLDRADVVVDGPQGALSFLRSLVDGQR